MALTDADKAFLVKIGQIPADEPKPQKVTKTQPTATENTEE
jgi:hypothetical protein